MQTRLIVAHIVSVLAVLIFGHVAFQLENATMLLSLGPIGLLFGIAWSKEAAANYAALVSTFVGTLGIPLKFAYC